MGSLPIRVFLSHAYSEKPLVRAVGDQLTRLGYKVWIDEDDLAIGDRIHAAIERAVDEADYLVLFISEASARSIWVNEEWRTKFDQQLSEERIRVLPIWLSGDEIPPALRGRLQIRLHTSVEVLRWGHRHIDAAIRTHEKRASGDQAASPALATLLEATASNIRYELASAFEAAASARPQAIVDALMAIRESAIARYDMGRREEARQIYEEMVMALHDAGASWGPLAVLPKGWASLNTDINALRESGRVADVWAARMVVDEIVEYFYAESIIGEFRSAVPGLAVQAVDIGRQFEPYWWPFDSLRRTLQGYKEHEIRSFPLLCELCEYAIVEAEQALSQRWAAGDKVDIQDAVILRMLRWPGLNSSPYASEALYVEEFGQVKNPIHVLQDIHFMDMTNFDTRYFATRTVIAKGSKAAFDEYLTERGYPRDDEYWSSSS